VESHAFIRQENGPMSNFRKTKEHGGVDGVQNWRIRMGIASQLIELRNELREDGLRSDRASVLLEMYDCNNRFCRNQPKTSELYKLRHEYRKYAMAMIVKYQPAREIAFSIAAE
jgi:hypothetical protein